MARYGYVPPEERDEEPSDFVRLLNDLDVGPQQTDAEPARDVAAPPPAAPARPKRDAELLAAQDDAADAAQRANLGRAGAKFLAAFGGYKPDTSFWDSLERQGDQGVADLEKRRASERQSGLDTQNAELRKAQIESFLRSGKGSAGNPAQSALMEARAEKIRTEMDGEKQDAEEMGAALEQYRSIVGKKLGIDASKLNEKMLLSLIGDEARAKLLKDRAAGRVAATGAKADKATEKRAATEAKQAEKAKGYFLEGYRLRPDARPRDNEVSTLRAAQASTNTIRETVEELENLYRKYGTSVLPSEARARAEALTTDLQLAMKGQEQYQLGVLAGPDMGLLEKTIPNPTGTKATLLDFFSGDQNVLARYGVLREQAQRRFSNKARSLGYEEDAGAGPSARRAPDAGASGATRVVGGKTYHQAVDGTWEVEE